MCPLGRAGSTPALGTAINYKGLIVSLLNCQSFFILRHLTQSGPPRKIKGKLLMIAGDAGCQAQPAVLNLLSKPEVPTVPCIVSQMVVCQPQTILCSWTIIKLLCWFRQLRLGNEWAPSDFDTLRIYRRRCKRKMKYQTEFLISVFSNWHWNLMTGEFHYSYFPTGGGEIHV